MDLSGWLGSPSAGRARRRALRRGADPHARLAVGGAVHAGAVAVERRARRGLRAAARDVVHTATAVAATTTDRDHAIDRTAVADRAAGAAAARRATLRRPVDVLRPAVDERWITGVEIVVLAFEWTFWFATWSAEIDRRVPWYGAPRLAAALLALVTPLLGVAGARLGGALAHRVLRGYDGVGRFERIGAACGLTVAAVAVVVIAWLARWRFTAGAGIGATHVPAVAMALVFGLVVVLDVLLRTFGGSEHDRRRRGLDREVAADRRRTARAETTVLAAEERARTAWYALRTRVQSVLAAAELVGITGDTLIADAVVRARAGHGPARPTPGPAAPALAGGTDGHRPPGSDRQRMLDGDHHVPFPLRHVADAIDVLAAHPPARAGDGTLLVTDLRRRLAALGGAVPDDARPDDARPDGNQPGGVRPGGVRPGGVRPGGIRTGDVRTGPAGRGSAPVLRPIRAGAYRNRRVAGARRTAGGR